MRLTRPGSIIVGDNTIQIGKGLQKGGSQDAQWALEYNQLVSRNPRLVALALAIDNDNTDGFTIAVVRPENGSSQ